MVSRRAVVVGAGLTVGGVAAGYLAWPGNDPTYGKAVAASRRAMSAAGAAGTDVGALVRLATLAANSHNTQPWLFTARGATIRIEPDVSRRCRVVDPEDRHLVASLGAATENLVLAAAAAGFDAVVEFESAGHTATVALQRARPQILPAFAAITRRQSTRAPFDPAPIPAEHLRAIESAIIRPGIRVRWLTARRDLDRLKQLVVQGNTVQCQDRAFVDELRHWVRFNQTDAAATRDGLYVGTTGNPALPGWLGRVIFPYVFTAAAENPKYLAQLDGSAGALVLSADVDEPSGWFDVGRASQRFLLEATARDIRTSFVNQPVEVDAVRAEFRTWLGDGLRPALVIRFGRGRTLPLSLRRPVSAVLRAG